MNKRKVTTLVLFGLLSTAFSAISANAACTAITALPKAITASGTYCLTGDLAASTASTTIVNGQLAQVGAITISADNVVLDLAGFEIKNTNTSLTTNLHTFGVYETGTHSNITVKNGRVNGYYGGVFFEDKGTGTTSNVLVDGISVYNNGWDGIRVDGKSAIIRNNRIYVKTAGPDNSWGIVATGPNTTIINNDIDGMITDSGIMFHGVDTGSTTGGDNLIENNRISTLATKLSGSVGIRLDGAGDDSAIVINNRIKNFESGLDFNGGSGIYRENQFLNNSINVINDSNAINAGNNN
jgi:hypothetical protein